jgi:hypothetical protein
MAAPIYLTRGEAAQYVQERGLPCARSTLGKLATTGGGPDYRKFGRVVVYTAADLDAWITTKLSAPRASSGGV